MKIATEPTHKHSLAERDWLRREYDRLKSQLEWRPIETAPKDRQAILLLGAAYEDPQTGAHPAKVAIGHWWHEGSSWIPEGPHKEDEIYTLQQTGVWLSGGGWFQPDEVTHWMPIPLSPKTQAAIDRGLAGCEDETKLAEMVASREGK